LNTITKSAKTTTNQILCLSFFDSILGPTTFYSSTPLIPEDHPDLTKILEFQDQEGSFIFTHRHFQTINHVFYINSDYARGGKDLLMITYMVRAAYYKDEITDVYNYLQSKVGDLEQFASELKRLRGLSKILHAPNKKIKNNLLEIDSPYFKSKFLKIFDKFYEKFSPEIPVTAPIIKKNNLKKIYLFGPRGSGKSTLLKNLEVIQFLQYKNEDKKRDLVNKIYDFIIDNIELMTYECSDEVDDYQQLSVYQECIDNAQGFILIYNASSNESVKDANDMLDIILERCSESKKVIPILIIGNIFNNKRELERDIDIKKGLDLGFSMKFYSINVLSDDQLIVDSLQWLVRELIQ
jgi:GTPase SAR1 family protein